MATLDNQEGVHQKVYRRITVDVQPMDGEEPGPVVKAFSYTLLPERCVAPDKRPSAVYKNVILTGAKEHRLPDAYVDKLKGVEDNGYDGVVAVKVSLTDPK